MRYTIYDNQIGMDVPLPYDPDAFPPALPVSQYVPFSFGGRVKNQTALGLQELANLHDTVLAVGNTIVTGTGGDVSEKHPTTVVRRPWLDQPEGSVGFDPQQVDTLTGVGTSVTGTCLIVPDGYDGVINGFNWNFAPTTAVTFQQGSGDLQAQIIRNGAPVRNYDNMLVEKGCILAPRPINPLRVYGGQKICMVVNHVANGLLVGDIITGLSGYFYPNKG